MPQKQLLIILSVFTLFNASSYKYNVKDKDCPKWDTQIIKLSDTTERIELHATIPVNYYIYSFGCDSINEFPPCILFDYECIGDYFTVDSIVDKSITYINSGVKVYKTEAKIFVYIKKNLSQKDVYFNGTLNYVQCKDGCLPQQYKIYLKL